MKRPDQPTNLQPTEKVIPRPVAPESTSKWRNAVGAITTVTAIGLAAAISHTPQNNTGAEHSDKKVKPAVHVEGDTLESLPKDYYKTVLNNPKKLFDTVQHMKTVKKITVGNDPYTEMMYIITQWSNTPKASEIPDVKKILLLIAEKNPYIIINFSNDIKINKNPKIAAAHKELMQKAYEILKVRDPEHAKWISKHYKNFPFAK